MRVLVSDPQIVFEKILKEVFASLDIDSLFFEDGAELMKSVEKGRVDMIIIALTLKDQDGIALTEKLRKIANVQFIPIIIFTSKTNLDRLGEAFSAGVTDVFNRKDIGNFTSYIERLLYYQRKVHGRALLVEDSAAQREVIRRVLVGMGLQVTDFASVEPAMLAHTSKPFDLIVSDIVLESNSSGLDLVHRVRRLDGIPGDTPILAITAYAKETMRINLMARGVDHCIAKPIVQPELEMIVRHLIDSNKVNTVFKKNSELEDANKENAILLASLKKNEDKLLTAEKISHSGYWEVDFIRGILSWSPEVFNIFELDPELGEPSYHEFLTLIHLDDRSLVKKRYAEAVNDNQEINITFKVVLESSAIKQLNVRSTLYFDEGNNPVRSTGSVQDITKHIETENKLRFLNEELESLVDLRTSELQSVNKALKNSSKAKSIFMANMSHEIRTPMNGVLGLASLLGDTELTELQQKYLDSITGSGRNLIAIINDILDFSKIESGKFNLENKEFSLNELVEDLTSPFQIKETNNVELRTVVDNKIPNILIGDKERLIQILNNLLSNAFKFTTSGFVTLKIYVLQKSDLLVNLRLQVSDTGIGITSKALNTLFEPFTQADQSITRKYGGTGLGLTISKNLVQLMGGEVNVKSKEGKGSQFSFDVSLEYSEKPYLTEPEKEKVSYDCSAIKVLLVEDNKINQMVAIGMAAKLGVKVDLAENGVEAIEMCCSHGNDYDLILMDCEMPVMDGYTATQKIRSWEKENNKLPVEIYALTAHVLPEYKERCEDVGMNGYLTKPINLAKLSEVFEEKVANL